MSKIKIESDGTVAGTIITDVESGNRIGWVQEITIKISQDNPLVEATMKILKSDLDIVANATRVDYKEINNE